MTTPAPIDVACAKHRHEVNNLFREVVERWAVMSNMSPELFSAVIDTGHQLTLDTYHHMPEVVGTIAGRLMEEHKGLTIDDARSIAFFLAVWSSASAIAQHMLPRFGENAPATLMAVDDIHWLMRQTVEIAAMAGAVPPIVKPN